MAVLCIDRVTVVAVGTALTSLAPVTLTTAKTLACDWIAASGQSEVQVIVTLARLAGTPWPAGVAKVAIGTPGGWWKQRLGTVLVEKQTCGETDLILNLIKSAQHSAGNKKRTSGVSMGLM